MRSRGWLATTTLVAVTGVWFWVHSLQPQTVMAATEFVVNGDFSGGTTLWTLLADNPPNSNIGVVDDGGNNVLEMQNDVVNADQADWHTEIWQAGQVLNTLVVGTKYTLSFRAKASVERPMNTTLFQYEGAPVNFYRYLGLKATPTITTSWKTYSYDFWMEAPMSSYDTQLSFAIGQAVGTVWLDDISLVPTPVVTYTGSELQLFNFDTSETWMSGAIQNIPNPVTVVPSDTTHVHEGDAALKLSAAVSDRAWAEHGGLWDFSANDWEMTMWVYIDNPADLGKLLFVVRSGSPTSLYSGWTAVNGLNAGWNQIVMPKSKFDQRPFHQADPDYSALWTFGLKLETNDNGPASVWIDDLRMRPVSGVQPPVISLENVDPLDATSATFLWHTDKNATSVVDCGTTTSYGLNVSDPTLAADHNLSLTQLLPNTRYHCQFSATDSNGRTARTGDLMFRTDPLTPLVLPNPASRFSVGEYGVYGFSEVGLTWFQDAAHGRADTFFAVSMPYQTDQQVKDELDGVQALGRKAVVGIDMRHITNPSDIQNYIINRVNLVKNHPAVSQWYLQDEPEFYPQSITPQQSKNVYDAIKAVDPNHEITFASTQYSSAFPFFNSLDAGIVETYPIPNDSIASLVPNIYVPAQASAKPYDVIVQTYQNDLLFSWPGNYLGPTRFPSYDEERAITYLGMNHGARNLAYYAYLETRIMSGSNWQYFKMNEMINEAIRMGPIWSSPETPEITLTSTSDPNLDIGLKQYRGKTYATVVNKINSPVSSTLTFTGLPISSVTEVVTQQTTTSTSTTIDAILGGYGVNIYQLAPADTTPPSVSITGPTDQATVSDAVVLTASASDNLGMAGVQFNIDGADFGSEDVTAPYEVIWPTTYLMNGIHTITAIARDSAGNSATSATITLTVANLIPDTTSPNAVNDLQTL